MPSIHTLHPLLCEEGNALHPYVAHQLIPHLQRPPLLQFRNFAKDLDGAFGVQEFVEQFLIVVQSFYRMR